MATPPLGTAPQCTLLWGQRSSTRWLGSPFLAGSLLAFQASTHCSSFLSGGHSFSSVRGVISSDPRAEPDSLKSQDGAQGPQEGQQGLDRQSVKWPKAGPSRLNAFLPRFPQMSMQTLATSCEHAELCAHSFRPPSQLPPSSMGSCLLPPPPAALQEASSW